MQLPQVQEHFAALWHQLRVEVLSGSGDQFVSYPFHREQHPSLHIDAQRCIWFCFASQCPGHRGGGIRELEALVGPLEAGLLPSGLVYHVPQQSDNTDTSELGNNSYPNNDALPEELKARARELFPVPEGQLPRIISRLCAFTQDPSRLIRKQVISNTWANPANRALKCRHYWAI